MDTDELYKQIQREKRRERRRRDNNEGRMTAAAFARLHGLNQFQLRHRMREAGYKRKGHRYTIPIKDLEKFR